MDNIAVWLDVNKLSLDIKTCLWSLQKEERLSFVVLWTIWKIMKKTCISYMGSADTILPYDLQISGYTS